MGEVQGGVHALGHQYSWFCERYRGWSGKLGLVMRQEHRVGEKALSIMPFSPWTWWVPLTGEFRAAQIFVAVLGASSYIFAEATWSPRVCPTGSAPTSGPSSLLAG
ncbi:hypothetical protein DFAR_3480014 [Desulfarculales bacterium]